MPDLMRLAPLIIVLIMASGMILPLIMHTGNGRNDTSSVNASDYMASTAAGGKYYVKYTEYLNSSKVINGNVNYYSTVPGPEALLSGSIPETVLVASGINSIYSVNESSFVTGVHSSPGSFTSSLSFGPNNRNLYLLPGSNNLTEWNLTTGVTRNVSVGSYPQYMAYCPLNDTMFVTVQGPKSLVAVNLTTFNVSYRLPLRFGPFGIAFDTHNGYIYISYPLGGIVSVFSPGTGQFVKNITIGGSPYDIAVSPHGNNVYVTNQGLNQVDVIDGTTQAFTGKINVGYSPSGIEVANGTGNIFVANTDSSNVSVIDASSNKVVQNLQVGSQPYALSYDSSNGVLAVGNHGSNSLSFIYPVEGNDIAFTENGLPIGTLWHVTVNGVTRYSNTGTISFDLGNAEINYSASPEPGYYGSLTGSMEVRGNTSIKVDYHSVSVLHEEILAVGASVAIAGAAGGLLLFRGKRRR
ncbi:hypothetical protein IX51_03610 [uncultured archaeon]|nr:hypothetical protein IX51_03610 [uncultured archaeon]